MRFDRLSSHSADWVAIRFTCYLAPPTFLMSSGMQASLSPAVPTPSPWWTVAFSWKVIDRVPSGTNGTTAVARA